MAGTDTAQADADAANPGDSQSTDAALDCPGVVDCPCEANDDRDFPICVASAAGRVCARPCVATCPGGESCVLYTPQGADTVSVCAPTGGLLCLPCHTDAQCRTIGAETATCVSHDQNGGFCGVGCTTSDDCPSGHVCADRVTTAGAATRQCVPDKAACTCSPGAVATAANTRCYLPDATVGGRFCAGVRTCGPAGLSACAPIAGADAVCVDAACLQNGKVGLPALADGSACSDGVVCTEGDACLGGHCEAGTNACECEKDADCKDDADLCNGVRYCDKSAQPFTCKTNPATVVGCPTGQDTVCSQNQCQPSTGASAMVPAPSTSIAPTRPAR